jgi:hypothetical protein
VDVPYLTTLEGARARETSAADDVTVKTDVFTVLPLVAVTVTGVVEATAVVATVTLAVSLKGWIVRLAGSGRTAGLELESEMVRAVRVGTFNRTFTVAGPPPTRFDGVIQTEVRSIGPVTASQFDSVTPR